MNSSSVNVSMPAAGSFSWVHHGRRLVELVLRGGRYAIRLRDPSALTRTEFQGVPTFPVSQEWVLQGCYTPFDEPRIVQVGRYGRTRSSPPFSCAVALGFGSTAYELAANSGKDGALTCAFPDTTNGFETAPWRAVTTSVSDEEGRVTIDFNRAVKFPFAFSDFGTWPARSRATGCRSR